MAVPDVTGVIDGAAFRFQCPHCTRLHTWSAEQVMNTTGNAIADECRECGNSFRVLKPSGRTPEPATSVNPQRPTAPRATPQGSEVAAATGTRYRYKVVPFIGRSSGSLSASAVADQLEAEIARHAAAGWEFYQLSDVNIEVQPGCIAGLFGATTQYVRFDQLIFRATGE
jgi:hypothetical protein